ncbi:hypothetical protein ACLBXM_19740 [Xanthobacteraceae bacterium A53D]
MPLTRRALLGGLSLGGFLGMGLTSPAAASDLYFAPGSRLGFRKPDLLQPLTRNARNLLAPDHTFQVMIWETLSLGPDADGDTWNDRPNNVKVLWERSAAPGETHRLMERTMFAGNTHYSWFTFMVRKQERPGTADWYGRLTLMTQPLGLEPDSGPGIRARWQETMEAIVASVHVRPALSVHEMLAEHGLAMDFSGLFPHHYGDKIVASLAPPRRDVERWTNDCHIAMHNPPAPLPLDDEASPSERATVLAESKGHFRAMKREPYTAFVSNEIDWQIEAEWPLEGTGLHVRSAQGLSRRGVLELRSYCRSPDRSRINAALDHVARSVRLVD